MFLPPNDRQTRRRVSADVGWNEWLCMLVEIMIRVMEEVTTARLDLRGF